MMDHRASPGISEDMANKIGLPAKQLGAGGLFEGAVLKCTHCPTPYIKNPDRKRQRNYCRKCKHYICDFCAETASKPDYIHRTFKEIIDMVKSGRYTVSGSTSVPILTPKGI